MNHAVTLVGKRWEVLERLSERRHYVSELASELGRKVPEASVQLQELLDAGLVAFEQYEGDRRKYYHLSDRGSRIYGALVEAASVRDERPGFEDWRGEEILGIVLDEGLPESLRISYCEEFVKICRDYPSWIVENEGARSLFERIASEPPTDRDRVLRELRKGFGAVLIHLVERKERMDWVWGEIYPSLLRHVERNMGSRGETLSWALRVIGDLAGAAGEEQRGRIRTDLLELYFNDRARGDGEASRMMIQVLKGLFSRSMLAEAKSRAKEESPSVRLKGVKLLQGLRDCMTPEKLRSRT
jgi:DNA-binding MarR family transcriptional regulator